MLPTHTHTIFLQSQSFYFALSFFLCDLSLSFSTTLCFLLSHTLFLFRFLPLLTFSPFFGIRIRSGIKMLRQNCIFAPIFFLANFCEFHLWLPQTPKKLHFGRSIFTLTRTSDLRFLRLNSSSAPANC